MGAKGPFFFMVAGVPCGWAVDFSTRAFWEILLVEGSNEDLGSLFFSKQGGFEPP